MPAKRRLQYITDHEDPKELVASLASQDILLTIRELGVESSLEIFELMKPEQVQDLFDLELWHNEELKPEEAGAYILALFEANTETAIEQMQGLDIELIGLMFKTTTTVFDLTLEEPVDYPELYSTTPGGRFLVGFDTDNNKSLAYALHKFLEELYSRDLEFVLRMLENVRFELASGLEAQSLHWRQNRLLDLGILPPEERLEYFSPVTGSHIPAKESFSAPKKLYLLKPTLESEHFLKNALNSVSHEYKENFWQEISHAALNMHASLSGDFGDQRAMITVSEYTKYLCELGLFQACSGQIERASTVLESSKAKYLIRLGRTALTSLRRRLVLKTKDQAYMFGDNFIYADSPLREVARALCLPEPRFYEGLIDAKKLTIRFFRSLSELNSSVKAINELIFRALLLGENGLDIKPAITSHLTHSGIFARVFINRFLEIEEVLTPISFLSMEQIIKDGRVNEDFKRYLKAEGQKLAAKLAFEPEAEQKINNFITTILIQLEQNWQLLLA